MKKEKIYTAATILFNHRMNATSLNDLPNDCNPKNLEESYLIQDELKKIYLKLKDNYIIGKKVGCTNKWAQKQINVNKPFYGNLFSKFSDISGCTLKTNKFSKPYMEPEFSFRINQDINISKSPFTKNQIIEFIDTVMCSVEIVDFRFNNNLKEIGIFKLIATNGASEYWIRNKEEFKIDDIDLENHKVEVYKNNKLIDKGNSNNVLNNPLNSLLWIINELSSKGDAILKNYLISTGTCTKAIPLEKNDNIKADFGKLGEIKFNFQ